MLLNSNQKPEVLTFNKTVSRKTNILLNLNSSIEIQEPYIYVSRVSKVEYSSRLDSVRFAAISSIVWGHALLNLKTAKFNIENHTLVHSVLLQLGRFGTIMFFLLSGFLLSDKIAKFNVYSYFKYRKNALIIPWLTFLSLFVMIELFKIYPLSELLSTNIMTTIKRAILLFRDFIFYAAYWYIPVSIISAVVLIIFKKYIETTLLGGVLLFITLFYDLNLYFGWISSNHTKAIFGYILFMWIGIMIKRNLRKVENILIKIPVWAFIVTILLFFTLSSWEGLILTKLRSGDPYASLRLSNSVLSILIFLFLLRIPSPNWINSLAPRKYVFGIYLIHCIIISEILTSFRQFLVENKLYSTLGNSILIQILIFVSLFLLNYIIAAIIVNSPLCFLFGKSRKDNRY